ncbi:hypothetical protein V8C86DRAFT_3147979, partial [Haematococcus lacustris]
MALLVSQPQLLTAMSAAVRQIPPGQCAPLLRCLAACLAHQPFVLCVTSELQGGSGLQPSSLLAAARLSSCCLAAMQVSLPTAVPVAAAARQLLQHSLAEPLVACLTKALVKTRQQCKGLADTELVGDLGSNPKPLGISLPHAALLAMLLEVHAACVRLHAHCSALHPEVTPLEGHELWRQTPSTQDTPAAPTHTHTPVAGSAPLTTPLAAAMEVGARPGAQAKAEASGASGGVAAPVPDLCLGYFQAVVAAAGPEAGQKLARAAAKAWKLKTSMQSSLHGDARPKHANIPGGVLSCIGHLLMLPCLHATMHAQPLDSKQSHGLPQSPPGHSAATAATEAAAAAAAAAAPCPQLCMRVVAVHAALAHALHTCTMQRVQEVHEQLLRLQHACTTPWAEAGARTTLVSVCEAEMRQLVGLLTTPLLEVSRAGGPSSCPTWSQSGKAGGDPFPDQPPHPLGAHSTPDQAIGARSMVDGSRAAPPTVASR